MLGAVEHPLACSLRTSWLLEVPRLFLPGTDSLCRPMQPAHRPRRSGRRTCASAVGGRVRQHAEGVRVDLEQLRGRGIDRCHPLDELVVLGEAALAPQSGAAPLLREASARADPPSFSSANSRSGRSPRRRSDERGHGSLGPGRRCGQALGLLGGVHGFSFGGGKRKSRADSGSEAVRSRVVKVRGSGRRRPSVHRRRRKLGPHHVLPARIVGIPRCGAQAAVEHAAVGHRHGEPAAADGGEPGFEGGVHDDLDEARHPCDHRGRRDHL